jgi:hypothetical protein
MTGVAHALPRQYFKAYWNESGEDVYEVSYRARAANGNACAGGLSLKETFSKHTGERYERQGWIFNPDAARGRDREIDPLL